MLPRADFNYFINEAKKTLDHTKVQEMDKYLQHGDTTCLKHCIDVAYLSFSFCRKLNIKCDYQSLIRGALLHDFFLYDWHNSNMRWHGLKHPKIALSNALKYFNLNKREIDIIKKHMWPLTFTPPRYLESYIVTFIDKHVSLLETFKYKKERKVLYNLLLV